MAMRLNLDNIPLIRPWPGDAGGVITLGLVITKDPETGVPNVGVYRLQKQSVNTMTVHWLSVRGGARHLRKAAAMGKKLEVAVAIGVHPLLVMAAATPIPVQLSEWLFAGHLCRRRGASGPVQNPRPAGAQPQRSGVGGNHHPWERCCRMAPSGITWGSTAVWRTHHWCASTA